jgi:hypothetical protein
MPQTKTKPPPRPLSIRVRVTQNELNTLNDAAELAGITTSSWSRMVLRKAAATDLHAAGKDYTL